MTPASPFPLPGTPRTAFPAFEARSLLHAPKRQRARDTEQALLAAGRTLLATRDFESISVAQIVAACELSVGAFYGRFRDKAAFFDALQAAAVRDAQQAIERHLALPRCAGVPTAVLIDRAMRLLVRGCRAQRGLLRAALQQAGARPQAWQPHRDCAAAFADRMVALLTPRLDDGAGAEAKVRFAMQAAFGMVIHALLHDPPPLRLDDDELPVQMARLIGGYLAPTRD